jgi:hypothetical protein
MRPIRFSLLALFVFAPVFRVLAAEPILKIVSPEKTLTFTAAEFAALPRSELKLPAQGDREEQRYSGVSLHELLTRVGAPFGDKMRGAGLLAGVIVRCKDNYAVLFSLAEFDENFSTRTIILADQEDGEMLPPSAAPFRIVAPGDKKGARSCKQVTSIEIVSLAKQP